MKMKAVLTMIRVIFIILLFRKTYCQDGYSEQDILRYQQMVANDGHDQITGYNNMGQRDNSHLYNSGSQQYHLTEDANQNEDYNRHERRSRKVYRIKNPFQQTEDNEKQETPQDVDTSASNQYAAIQYSLPPEQFLAQMKAEGQYQQYSTPSPAPSYTATPQPYQYSTVSASGYDNNPQPSYNGRAESRTYTPTYNNNNFQYNGNQYNQDVVASTPIPTYLSTALPSNQYLGTPANTYLSSPASIYLSSPQSIQQYVSSPVSFDYNNRVSTIGSEPLNYPSEANKRIQIDHYDNSGNILRYSNNNVQGQYHNELPSSTISPTAAYYDNKQESYNNGNTDNNQAQYNNLRYNTIQSNSKQDSNIENVNSDTHRIGSMPAANNVYLNFVKPDYQILNNNYKNQEQESPSSTPSYSHGDYGWKLSDKRSNYGPESTTPANNFHYQIHSMQPDTGAFSQVRFQMDSGKDYGYDQTPRPSNNKIDPEEFAKAAAKAHENYKQTLKATSYASNSQYNSNYFANNPYLNSYFVQSNKQKQTYDDSPNQNNNQNSPYDLVTASPYYYTSPRENLYDSKQKLPFDHDKALKNIVPIDVSNVVQQQNGLIRGNSISDSLNKVNLYNIGKDHSEGIQQSTPANDAIYYKDKNSFFSLNLKPKPEHYEQDRLKQPDAVSTYYGKEQGLDSLYNNGLYSTNKRFVDQRNGNPNQVSYNNQDNAISPANNIQQSLHRPNQQSDGSGFLKFNDIPHRLTEAYTAESLRMNNNNNFDQNNLPNPLPLRLNQNVDNHHLDVATEILGKLMANKGGNLNRPDFDQQAALATINGLKIANPYNVDLSLVADMLKGKSNLDSSQLFNLRDNPSIPLKFDVSQLQQMNSFKNDNPLSLSSALSVLANPYYDIYNGGRFPYQGVKYSRSEEEAENIPIADASSNLSIGAVIDGEETVHIPEESSINEHQEDINPTNIESEKSRVILDTESKIVSSRDKHFNSPYLKRQPHGRKYPKNEIHEPYPLLKPPPPLRSNRFGDKNRRRLHKHKILRVLKTEPLFEAGTLNVEEFNSRSDTFPERDIEIGGTLT